MKRIQGERGENIEKAINCFNKELEIHTQNHYPQEWLKVKNDLGVAYSDRIQGDHSENIKQAIHHLTEALQAFPHNRFPEQLDWLSHNLASVLFEEIFIQGNYLQEDHQQIIFNFTDDLQEFIQKCEPEKWANIQRHLGDFYDANHEGDRAKNLEQAIYFYAKALQVFTQEEYPQEWAKIQQYQGNSYLRRIRGDTAENIEIAINCFTQALQVFTPEGEPQQWAKAKSYLGVALRDRIYGDQSENLELALKHCIEASQANIRKENPELWAEIQIYLATVYVDRLEGDIAENTKQAIGCLQQALQEYTPEENPQMWISTHMELGIAYSKSIITQGSFVSGGSLISSRSRNLGYLVETLDDVVLPEKSENIEQAIYHYQQALQICTHDNFPQRWADIQHNLAAAYLIRIQGNRPENIAQAIHCLTEQLQIYTPNAFPDQCYEAGLLLGNIAFIEKIWHQAIFGYAQAIAAVETSRTWATSETRRQEILEEFIDIYHKMVQACINAGQIDKALEYVERSRSKRLVDLMASKDLYQSGEIPQVVQEFLQQYESLQQQIDNFRSQNNFGSERELAGVSNRNRAALEADNEIIAALEAEKQQVWEKLRQLDPVVAGEIQVSPPKLAAMQQLIDQPITAILSFYSTEEDTHIFVLRQNQISLHTCEGQGQENLQAWIREKWLMSYVSDRQTWETLITSILGELGERLQLSNLISQHLQGIAELILVPHLLLHQIPFAALPVEENYLGDKFLIRYIPSCQILEFCQQRGKLETLHTNSLQYGTVEDATNDLPFASFEGEQIANLHLIPDQRRLKGKTQATLHNYQQLAQKVQVLHSCHHAQSRLDNPLESQLKLGDGSITLGQLMSPSWRLPNLFDVFLSCCETNLGNPSLTDDILTLSTGFLCAGARSVVSTLWSVNDLATALFSIFYYQQRKEGKSRPEALQQAQIKLRESKKEYLIEKFTEISKQAELKRKEARNQRKKYPVDSPEYLECDREYRKYAGVMLEITKLKNSSEKFPFAYPHFWAAFACQGLS
ncbi:CHAT domain-containing protein [Fischerella sp. FACHB-380]|nr:CHAT domain-containing protein [Fischerella sp. FACHB-380]